MAIFEFLSLLNTLDINIWIEEGQLRYRAPKGAMTAEIKQELKERKTEILAFLKEAQTATQLTSLSLVPVSRDKDLPLSFAQQRMWFLSQLDGESTFYNESFQLRILGKLSVKALEQTINEIIRRHEALRTNFPTVEGVALQVIRPNLTITIPVIDVQNLTEASVKQIVTLEVSQPFELETDPLVRATLLQQEAESHLLILTMHHIIIDGWSMGVFFKELEALYPAFTTGQPNPLPELTIQYADFALWQRQWLTKEVQEKQLEYWKQQLAGAPPLLELPTDYSRPPVQTFAGATTEFQIDAHLTSQLVTLSQKSGVTLFMTLLTAFSLLLHRYSGQDDLCIGSPFANRDRREIDTLIGFFVNTLVLRTQLEGNPSFSQLLEKVRSVVWDAHAHQDIPFEQIVEALKPERSLSYNPLFQVLFVLENFSLDTLELPGISLTPEMVDRGTAKFDLSVSAWQTQKGLVGFWEYNSDIFAADTIARMISHFQTLLAAIVKDPHQKLRELPLLTASEQYQLLVDWNDTQADYPVDKCIHQLFEEQVEKTPDAVAVVFEKQQLTYQQLNCRANQLADYLQSLGVKPDTLVGICVERSLDMVVGLFGILKAGGAYLPLDSEYPQDRLSFMLEDSQVSVLLTQQRLIDRLPEHQAKLVCLDKIWEQIAQNSQDNPTSGVRAFNLANVIYTSGSTGKPKGVMVEHKGLCNLAQAQIQTFGVDSDSRVLQFASFSFDASISEILMALGSGATLYLGTKDALMPGKPLTEQLCNHGITHITLPPSALAVMPGSQLSALQTIIVAGEACSEELIRQWSVGRNFFNAYGPTEATVCATIAKCNENERITIGKAIANTQIHILDEYLQPVPVGVPGELHISGVGLARGYLNRPELTQEKFVSNPFHNPKSKIQNPKLYKTGDLGRYLPDGNIEYLGRIDNQVKIRGFRIELGEIEAVLSQHHDVQICCVIAHEETPDNKRLVAYLGTQKDATLTTDELRQFLADKLPGYMLPTAFIILDSLPLTPNGKVDRRALPHPDLHQQISDYVMPNTEVERIIADIWQQALKVEKVGVYNNFFELGGHSLLLVKVNQQLQEKFGLQLSIVDMFNYPTIHSLSQYLITKLNQEDPIKQNNDQTQSHREIKSLRNQQSEIAIISVAGRFPGAKDIESFWQNLRDGVESISRFTDEELLESGVSPDLLNNSNYVKASAFLSDIELFDANFFAYSAKEAELIDPQQRIFLELAWEAVEKAGYDPQTYNGLIGIYAGVGMSGYLLNNLYPHHQLSEIFDAHQLGLSNDKDFLPTRVAYKLNLTGPAVNIQTACSTSLVAVHQACQSLLNRECDIALAGGVSLGIPQKTGYLYQEGMILSPDGHCRTFDAKAQGTIASSGAAIVVLKRLEDAIADHDHIHAIIKGSAINNDGAMKVGYTAPSVSGQAAVISEAQAIAGIKAETISYIEAHGTATPLGDPIEIAALTQAFKQTTDKKSFCAIGSLKSNLGHLDTAAGVAGLIKTVLALQHKILPPSLHFETPNPKIDFANSPFYVNTTLTEWKTNNTPRRAGVSSFGMGGTNAHIILEEAPVFEQGSREQGRNYQLLCLSAKTPKALETATNNLITHLQEHPELNLGDVAYTLNSGRRGFNHRRILIAQNLEDAIQTLSNLDPKQVFTNYTEITERTVVFMFPGQGSQYVNMAREIYETETVFKEQIDYCSEILKPLLGLDLRQILYPNDEKIAEASKQLEQTAISQPAIFVIEYALAKLWQSWGVNPQAAIGHSIGEYVAATLAGVFSLEDALSLVAARGQMMQQLPTGAMLSVPLPAEKVKSLLGKELSLAAINQPSQCVVSGSIQAIEALQNQLAAQGIECRRLHTSHAFHSHEMEPILEAFTERVKKVNLNPPKLPYISNLTGTWITVTQATNPDYYAQHLRSTVLFAQGVEKLLATPEQVLLEIGAGHTLTKLAKRHPEKIATQTVLNSVRHPQEKKSDLSVLYNTLGQLWLAGVKVDWWGFYSQDEYYRLPLPTYPFERQHYWIEPPKENARKSQLILRKKTAIADWFYIPSWKRSPLPVSQIGESQDSILLFINEYNLDDQLAKQLQKNYQKIIIVKVGESFKKENSSLYTINPRQSKDYETLLIELGKNIPKTILHLWSMSAQTQVESELEEIAQDLDLGFYSLLFLAQAFGQQNINDEFQLIVVSNNMQDITGDEELRPEQATLIGPIRTIPQEYPYLHCRIIDVVIPQPGSFPEKQLIEQLEAELKFKSSDQIIAYRKQHRWVESFEYVKLDNSNRDIQRLKEGGVYLITGGLGGIGLTLAEYLAQTVRAKLILIGRANFPTRNDWEKWYSSHDAEDSTSSKIRKLYELEKLGAKVLVVKADVTNLPEMQTAIAQATAQFGKIDGVIHSAGVPAGGLIQQKTREQAENVMASKIKGSLILDTIFRDSKLDFFVVLSSLNSIIPALGQVDYCAANAFLDAFAHRNNKRHNTFTVSINWDGWQEVGMAADAAKKFGDKLDYTYLQQTLLSAEGVEAFSRILHNQLPQVLVSTVDFLTRLRQVEDSAKQESVSLPVHSRPQLNNFYVAPSNWVEEKIADIWQELLGIKQVGIHDNFFELGGDSLIAVQVLSRLRKTFSIQFSVASLLESPTIAEIASKLEKQLEPYNNLDAMEREEMTI